MGDVAVVVEHQDGKPSEVSYELLGKGKELAGTLGGELVAVILAADAKPVAEACGVANTALCVEHEALGQFNPEAYTKALASVLKEHPPQILLVSNTSKGMDLAPNVALALGVPLVTNVSQVRAEGGRIHATSQIYGGKISADVEVLGERCVFSVLAGSFPAESGKRDGAPTIESGVAPGDLGALRVAFRNLIQPEAADVDITREDVLVSVGRGIQDKDNLSLVQELADALGCPLAASRPIVDLGWLPKSRQVGKSGVSVKPRLYIAIGISGAPEHLQGMKDASTIIAINTDEKAPIFDVAHYGVTADLFDVVPALTEKIKDARG